MTSPYAAGGGGTQFEASVAAYYLSALLCEHPARGVPGNVLASVRSQRADFEAPLDDLVIAGIDEEGQTTGLHLQIKNKVSFTTGDENWIDVLGRAWNTLTTADPDIAGVQLGVAIGRYSSRADDHYQSVLLWARYSENADDFFSRIEKKDFSSATKITFVKAIREILDAHVGRPTTHDEIWRLLKRLVILHFDFQNGDASRDGENVRDRLGHLFPSNHSNGAARLWEHLVGQATRLIPAAGSLDRDALRERMHADGFSLNHASGARRRAVAAIDQESRRALAEIKSNIGGLYLHRQSASLAIRRALDKARFIQIIGEPGTGKSALLKEFADECAQFGPVMVLKDARIQPRGWAAQASVLGISSDCAEVLTDLSGAGDSILFIDGIDKIVDPAVQVTVNDILRTIASSALLAEWKILVTVREQNLRHLETWIDGDVFKVLPIATVTVSPLDAAELETVGDYFHRLKPLLAQRGVDAILHRPFFINALIALPDRTGGNADLPATEVALMQLWWSLGGGDRQDFALAQEQRETLISLGDRLARSPNTAISLTELAPQAIERLHAAGILRNVELGHTVVFAHDIYEEWALCEMLIRHREEVPSLLRGIGEPQSLIRPLQLFGTYLLETESTTQAWQRLAIDTGDGELRSVWHRAVLLSCLQSTRSTLLLNDLSTYLLAENAKALSKLLLALRTVEVIPDRRFLNEALTPDLEPAERAKFANLSAFPRIAIWIRLLDWLMPNLATIPNDIIPADLLPVFSAWLELCAGQNIRHCRDMGRVAGDWLAQTEGALHPDNVAERQKPLGISMSYDNEKDFEKSLRKLFLRSAADAPNLVSSYLAAKGQSEDIRHYYLDSIMESAAVLAEHVPKALVDFMLAVFPDDPADLDDDPFRSRARYLIDDHGIRSDHDFSPASPLQPPFLILLREHEAEGLRLIHTLCNHSIGVWRWGRTHPAHYAPATPLPIELSWDDHVRQFWGDNQVYLWFRGTWGSHAVRSGLMALELWALQKIEAGAPFDEIFDKVLGENQSVAILGIAVSLCLAFPQKSASRSLPLVTSPHLWGWDLERYAQDRMPANQIGDWYRHRHLLNANKILNEREHRKREIRDLLLFLIFGDDQDVRQRILAGVSAFPKNLPFQYEEERQNPNRVASLAKTMGVFAELGDIENWHVEPTEDGNASLIRYDSPSAVTIEAQAASNDNARLNECLALALWAQKCLDEDVTDPKISLHDAWRRAQDIDDESTFVVREDEFRDGQRDAAVAGVAFALARFSEDEAALNWSWEVLNRAAIAPEMYSEFLVRDSLLSMHPKVYAVHGFSAFLARDLHVDVAQDALLRAALHPLIGIAGAVFIGMAMYAPKYKNFCWVLMALGIGRSIADYNHIPNYHRVIPDAHEIAVNDSLLSRARDDVARDRASRMPSIPMTWVKEPILSRKSLVYWGRKVRDILKKAEPNRRQRREPRDYGRYRRNQRAFLWNIAEKLTLKAPVQALVDDRRDADRLTELACQLRDFTITEIIPPFARSRRDHDGHTPFNWVFDCSRWIGTVLSALPTVEEKRRLIDPILATENDTALLMLRSIMRSFLFRAIAKPTEVTQANMAMWHTLADWLLANPLAGDAFDDHLDGDYSECIFCLTLCVTADFSPLQCVVDPGWKNLPLFQPTVERVATQLGANSDVFRALTTLLNRGGQDWLPEPGLTWIEKVAAARKADLEFWESHGENAVIVLKEIVAVHGSDLPLSLRERIIHLADTLVDCGVRGAGFLQQELLRQPSSR